MTSILNVMIATVLMCGCLSLGWFICRYGKCKGDNKK